MENAENAAIALGHVIRNQRKKKRLSQTGLALLAGVSLNLVSQIESGKPRVQLVKILHLLNVLGLQLKVGVGRDVLVLEKYLQPEESGE